MILQLQHGGLKHTPSWLWNAAPFWLPYLALGATEICRLQSCVPVALALSHASHRISHTHLHGRAWCSEGSWGIHPHLRLRAHARMHTYAAALLQAQAHSKLARAIWQRSRRTLLRAWSGRCGFGLLPHAVAARNQGAQVQGC